MPKKFDPEIKARAVRMVRRHLAEYGSVTKTSEMVGKQLDISSNTLRRWVVQADIDDGQRDGVPTTTLEELAALEAGVHRRPGRRGLRRRVDLHRPHQRGLSGRGEDLSQLEPARSAGR